MLVAQGGHQQERGSKVGLASTGGSLGARGKTGPSESCHQMALSALTPGPGPCLLRPLEP